MNLAELKTLERALSDCSRRPGNLALADQYTALLAHHGAELLSLARETLTARLNVRTGRATTVFLEMGVDLLPGLKNAAKVRGLASWAVAARAILVEATGSTGAESSERRAG